jgi:hypothetical protein
MDTQGIIAQTSATTLSSTFMNLAGFLLLAYLLTQALGLLLCLPALH